MTIMIPGSLDSSNNKKKSLDDEAQKWVNSSEEGNIARRVTSMNINVSLYKKIKFLALKYNFKFNGFAEDALIEFLIKFCEEHNETIGKSEIDSWRYKKK